MMSEISAAALSSQPTLPSAQAIAEMAIAALEEIKGEQIEAFDTSAITPLFERVVIASGNSTRQVKALARNVVDQAKKLSIPVVGVEGEEAGEWVLVDLGSVIVHVMLPPVRHYYRLEELWGMPPATRVAASTHTAPGASLLPPGGALGNATSHPSSRVDPYRPTTAAHPPSAIPPSVTSCGWPAHAPPFSPFTPSATARRSGSALVLPTMRDGSPQSGR